MPPPANCPVSPRRCEGARRRSTAGATAQIQNQALHLKPFLPAPSSSAFQARVDFSVQLEVAEHFLREFPCSPHVPPAGRQEAKHFKRRLTRVEDLPQTPHCPHAISAMNAIH